MHAPTCNPLGFPCPLVSLSHLPALVRRRPSRLSSRACPLAIVSSPTQGLESCARVSPPICTDALPNRLPEEIRQVTPIRKVAGKQESGAEEPRREAGGLGIRIRRFLLGE